VKWLTVIFRLSARRARRRRLLKACRWHSAGIDVRQHVRRIERVLEDAAKR
jgi:hypothetical protein